jgi:hypothetical protein
MSLTVVYGFFQNVSGLMISVWLVFLIHGILNVTRRLTEKVEYDCSHSSVHGDLMLFFAIGMASDILKRTGIPVWAAHGLYLETCLAASIIFGVLWQVIYMTYRGRKYWGDSIHNLFSAPLMLFLLLASVPPAWVLGTLEEKLGMEGLTAVWMLLVFYDSTQGRLKPHKWMQDRGFQFRP